MSNPNNSPSAAPSSAGEPASGRPLIVEVEYTHPHARRLVGALFDDQVKRYGYADPVEADPAAYQPPDGLFLVGYREEQPVCCGGYRRYRLDVVEIKKMYTVFEYRGHGYGRAIITALERHAAEGGFQTAILETGVRNTAALALYADMGYRPVPRYAPGRDPAINRAFSKSLLPAAIR